jgi:hypothetical protein
VRDPVVEGIGLFDSLFARFSSLSEKKIRTPSARRATTGAIISPALERF